MITSRRLALILVGLALLALSHSATLTGEPANLRQAAVPTARQPAPAGTASDGELPTYRFENEPLITYRMPNGELLFGLQLQPKLPAQPRRPRDILVMVSISASQAGPAFVASGQIARSLFERAGLDDRLSLWTLGTPDGRTTRCLTETFVNPHKEAERVRSTLEALRNKAFPAGDTDLKSGLEQALDTFEDVDGKQRVVLFLGDGWSTHGPLTTADRERLCQAMVRRRIAFFAVPLGMNPHPENLHRLTIGTGGKVVRADLGREKLTDILARCEEAFSGAILYEASLRLPQARQVLPESLPPLRGDTPTLVVGRLQACESLACSLAGKLSDTRAVDISIGVKMAKPEADHYFLANLVEQWRKTPNRPALLRADRSLLLAFEQTRLQRADLLVGAQLAVEKDELNAAVRLFEQARQLAPHDAEARAGLKIVKQLQNGTLTRQQIREQLVKEVKGGHVDIAAGAARWDRARLLRLTEIAADEPVAKVDAGPLQAQRDRIIIEEQRMTEIVENAIRQARKEVQRDPRAALEALTNHLVNVRDHQELGEAARRTLLSRLETAARDTATRARTIAHERQLQQKNLAVLQNELKREDERRSTDERVEAQLRVFRGIMAQARMEEHAKRQAIAGLVVMQEEARARGVPVPVATQAAYDQVLASYNLQKYQDLRRLRQERFLATMLEVEKSHVPFPDEPTIHFPPLAMWDTLRKLRKEKYEVSSLPDDDKGRAEANAINRLLGETIETDQLQIGLTLKEFIGLVAEKFAARGKELPIIIDTEAFKEDAPEIGDLYDTPVRFPPYPKRMTVATALRLALAKIPTNNATYLIRRNFVEVTTIERQTREKVLRVYPVGDLVIPISGGTILGSGGGFAGGGGFPGGLGGMAGGFPGGLGGFPGGFNGGFPGGLGFPGAAGFPGGIGGFPGGAGLPGGFGVGFPGAFGGGAFNGFPGGVGVGIPGGVGFGAFAGNFGGVPGGIPGGFGGGGLTGGGFNGNLGALGATQANQLIQTITQVVAPGEWFVAPQPANNGFLAGNAFGGNLNFLGNPAPPPPVAQGGPADIQQANTIQFFPSALALVVRAPSRVHTSLTGGVFGARNKRDVGARLQDEEPRHLADALRKGKFAVAAANRPAGLEDSPSGVQAERIWNDVFAKGGIEAGHVVATADFLFERGHFAQTAEFLKANLRHGIVVRPWVYEALAVALEASQATPEDVRRVRLSAVSLDPKDAAGFLRAARMLGEHKEWARALTLCRQAAALDPASFEPYAMALELAERNDDAAALTWAAEKLLGRDWPTDNVSLRHQAESRLQAVASKLAKEGRHAESQRLQATMRTLSERDVVVHLTWESNGTPSQLELQVKEPSGTACSLQQASSPGGGILLSSDSIAANKTTYVAAQGFPGEYEVRVRRLWGQPVGARARLEIVLHQGTPREQRRLEVVPLTADAIVKVKLENGRRTTLAAVAAATTAQRSQASEVPAAGASVISKLRDIAHADVSEANGPRGAARTPGATVPSLSAFVTPVASISGSTSVTAQVRLTSSRQEMELVLRPIFRVAGGGTALGVIAGD